MPAKKVNYSPTKNTKYKVEYEECTNDDHAYKVDPWPTIAHRVIYLQKQS